MKPPTHTGSIGSLAARVVRQVAALVALSAALGLVFNAANPIGIRIETGGSTRAEPKGQAPPQIRISQSSNGVYRNQILALTLGQANQTPPARPPGVSPLGTITWEETQSLLQSGRAVLIDARSPAAFAAGHITKAVSLPFSSAEATLAEFRRSYNADTPLIIYCANEQCPIADHMADRLRNEAGFKNVRVFPGGYMEWQRTGRTPTAQTQTKTPELP